MACFFSLLLTNPKLTQLIEALKQLYVIPRTPSPSPSRQGSDDSEDDVQELVNGYTPNEIEDLVRQFMEKTMGSGSRGVKRKRDGKGFALGKTMKKIKKEHIDANEKRRAGMSVSNRRTEKSKDKGNNGEPEMIDILSDDDGEDDEELFVRQGEKG
jgi:ribosomal protein L13E